MTTKNLLIEQTTSNAFASLVAKEVAKLIESKLPKIQVNTEDDGYMTRQEVAEMLSVSICTVHNWAKKGILIPHRIGNKTRFLKGEVKASVKVRKAITLNNEI